MASAKSYLARRGANYRFLSSDPIQKPHPMASELELDESDIWGGSNGPDSPESRPRLRQVRRPLAVARSREVVVAAAVASSLPVNIPDWSKILRDEYKVDRWSADDLDGDGEDDDGEDDNRMPPHEYLACTRMASFSVHEGIGRTLKGRDLSRVRNAIFEKTGFQD